jgi:hypothetical protein
MDLKATIEHIQATADKSNFKTFIPPRGVNGVRIDADGDSKFFDAAPVRHHTIDSVEDIQPYLGYAVTTLDAKPIVWIGNDSIVITLNDTNTSDRKDTASLAFTYMEEFCKVVGLAGQAITQKEFLRLVRVTFYDCFPSNDDRLVMQRLLKTVSQRSDQDQGTVTRATISGEYRTEWPDLFVLRVRVLTDPYLAKLPAHDIRIHMEVRPDGYFELIPNASDIKHARDNEIANLLDKLRADVKDTPIFRGHPDIPGTTIENSGEGRFDSGTESSGSVGVVVARPVFSTLRGRAVW